LWFSLICALHGTVGPRFKSRPHPAETLRCAAARRMNGEDVEESQFYTIKPTKMKYEDYRF